MHPDLNTVVMVLGFILTIGLNRHDVSRLDKRMDRIVIKFSSPGGF